MPACRRVPDWQGRALAHPSRVTVDGQAAHLIQQPVQSLLVGPMQLLRLPQHLVPQQPLPDSAPLEAPTCLFAAAPIHQVMLAAEWISVCRVPRSRAESSKVSLFYQVQQQSSNLHYCQGRELPVGCA